MAAEKIVVIGSMNMDMLFSCAQYPEEGETIIGNSYKMLPGGKGANQAAIIAELGGKVTFISGCGRDYFGDKLIASLKEKGVNTAGVSRFKQKTGMASISIDKNGSNRIIVVSGANYSIKPDLIKKHTEIIKDADILLLQMEIPVETVLFSIKLASQFSTKVILDPAPARDLPEDIYKGIDFITPNIIELNQLTEKYNLPDQDSKARKLLDLGVGTVLLTAGEGGVYYYTGDIKEHLNAIEVDVVDSTGAGDAFAGAFALGLYKKWPINKVIKFAIVTSGLVVKQTGAQSSIPDKKQIDAFLNGQV